jgi:hypothetical protein
LHPYEPAITDPHESAQCPANVSPIITAIRYTIDATICAAVVCANDSAKSAAVCKTQWSTLLGSLDYPFHATYGATIVAANQRPDDASVSPAKLGPFWTTFGPA